MQIYRIFFDQGYAYNVLKVLKFEKYCGEKEILENKRKEIFKINN